MDVSGNNKLNQVIAAYLQAVEDGQEPDREGLLGQHPDLAGSLRSFFSTHDQMSDAAKPREEEATLPPSNPGSDTATIPPVTLPEEDETVLPATRGSGDATIPPSGDGSATIGAYVRYFGDYELLEEIARGGMGVVYKARQVTLNRIVALKMILAGQLAGEDDVKRFYVEAEAAANLQHPNIVPIYEIGENEGQHYFSMGFVDGMSLADRIKDGPLPPREAAEYTKKVAEAVAFAHERGVIHRDLKPANLLLDAGEPKVTDFGLAKKVEDDSGLTATGQVLGTPSYMPPEQAGGKIEQVTELADVYSLGAILYALVTGRPPFQAASHLDTLLQVIDQEPVSPRVLNAKIPQDLETICLQCLEKEPERRYPSAADLAEDLRRYLEGVPTSARPVGLAGRLIRWSRRNVALTALSFAVAVTLIAGSSVSTYFGFQASHRALESEKQARLVRLQLYVAHMKLVEGAWQVANLTRMQELLDQQRPENTESDLRGFEWYYYKRLSQSDVFSWRAHAGSIHDFAFDPSGRWLATCGEDSQIMVRDVRGLQTETILNHASPVFSLSFSPKGDRLASADNQGTVKLWDTNEFRALAKINASDAMFRHLRFSPDGTHLVAGEADGKLRIWDVASRQETHSTRAHQLEITGVAFSSNGELIATCSKDGTVKLWSTSELELVHELRGHASEVWDVAFAPHDRFLASAGEDRTLIAWNSVDGNEFARVAFSPDNRWLASVSADSTIKIWDTQDHRHIKTITGSECWLYAVKFSRDGRQIVTANRDHTAKVWNIETGELIHTLTGHTQEVWDVEFTSDGKIITGSQDGSIRIWDANSGRQLSMISAHSDEVWGLALSHDETIVASASADGIIKVWNFQSGELIKQLTSHEDGVTCVAFSPDGRWLASGSKDRSVVLWETKELTQWKVLKGHSSMVFKLAFSSDGKHLPRQAGTVQSNCGTWLRRWRCAVWMGMRMRSSV